MNTENVFQKIKIIFLFGFVDRNYYFGAGVIGYISSFFFFFLLRAVSFFLSFLNYFKTKRELFVILIDVRIKSWTRLKVGFTIECSACNITTCKQPWEITCLDHTLKTTGKISELRPFFPIQWANLSFGWILFCFFLSLYLSPSLTHTRCLSSFSSWDIFVVRPLFNLLAAATIEVVHVILT